MDCHVQFRHPGAKVLRQLSGSARLVVNHLKAAITGEAGVDKILAALKERNIEM